MDLRSVRGQLQLLALTLVGAALFAVGVSTQRAWFEGFVRQKLPETAPEVRAATQALLAGDPRSASALPPDRRAQIYQLWLKQDPLADQAGYAAALWGWDPQWTAEQTERTFLAGSPEQRERALQLVLRAPEDTRDRLLEGELARAERLGLEEWAEALRRVSPAPGQR